MINYLFKFSVYLRIKAELFERKMLIMKMKRQYPDNYKQLIELHEEIKQMMDTIAIPRVSSQNEKL